MIKSLNSLFIAKEIVRAVRGRGRAAFCVALAGAYLFSNVVGAHAAESAFWKERRNAAQRMQQKSSLSESLPALGLAAEERARAGLTSEQYQMLAQLPKAGQVNFGAVADIPITNGWPGQGLGEKIPAGLKGGQSADDSPSWLSTLILPYGTLRDVYLSPVQNAPLVIHIQDAHEIQEAQKNMAAMIQGLREGRGITLVGLEGASGAFALEPYRSYPNAAVTRGIAEYFLKEGYIGGAEFVGLTAPEPPTLWGVEDLSLYQGNIQAFKDSVRFRADLRAFLKRLKTAADRLKFRVYSNPLKDFDRHFNAYKNRQEGLGDYVRFLMDARQNPRGYPNLYLLLDALEWEESLDFRRVEKERLQLVEVLARELSEAQLNHLVQQSLLYRLGRMGYGDYHRFLRQLCRDNGIRLEDFGQLDSYITYVLLAERINRNELLVELTRLEDDTQAALAATPEQKKMVLVNRNLMLLEKLAGHAMTPVDWHYYDAKRPEVLRVVQDLEQMGQSLGDPLSLDAPQNVPAMLEPFEQFCRRALERNRALVDNLLQKLKEKAGPSSPSVAVLVAGGFHTDGLSQLLRSKDISYVVVTPKISEVPKESKYLDIFAHDPLPLEKLFAGETIYLAAERLLVLDGAQIKFSHTRLSAFRGLYRMFQPALQALFEEAGEDMETLQESLNRQSSEVSAALGEKELRIEIDRDISRRGFYSVLRYSLTAENGAPVRAQLAVMTKDKLAAAKQFLEEEGMQDAVHEAEITVDGETYVLVLFKSSSITDTLAGHWDKFRGWLSRMRPSAEEKPGGAATAALTAEERLTRLEKNPFIRRYFQAGSNHRAVFQEALKAFFDSGDPEVAAIAREVEALDPAEILSQAQAIIDGKEALRKSPGQTMTLRDLALADTSGAQDLHQLFNSTLYIAQSYFEDADMKGVELNGEVAWKTTFREGLIILRALEQPAAPEAAPAPSRGLQGALDRAGQWVRSLVKVDNLLIVIWGGGLFLAATALAFNAPFTAELASYLSEAGMAGRFMEFFTLLKFALPAFLTIGLASVLVRRDMARADSGTEASAEKEPGPGRLARLLASPSFLLLVSGGLLVLNIFLRAGILAYVDFMGSFDGTPTVEMLSQFSGQERLFLEFFFLKQGSPFLQAIWEPLKAASFFFLNDLLSLTFVVSGLLTAVKKLFSPDLYARLFRNKTLLMSILFTLYTMVSWEIGMDSGDTTVFLFSFVGMALWHALAGRVAARAAAAASDRDREGASRLGLPRLVSAGLGILTVFAFLSTVYTMASLGGIPMLGVVLPQAGGWAIHPEEVGTFSQFLSDNPALIVLPLLYALSRVVAGRMEAKGRAAEPAEKKEGEAGTFLGLFLMILMPASVGLMSAAPTFSAGLLLPGILVAGLALAALAAASLTRKLAPGGAVLRSAVVSSGLFVAQYFSFPVLINAIQDLWSRIFIIQFNITGGPFAAAADTGTALVGPVGAAGWFVSVVGVFLATFFAVHSVMKKFSSGRTKGRGAAEPPAAPGSWFGEDYERFVLDPALRAFFSLHARVWDDMVDSLAGWGLNRNAAEALRAAQDMDDAVALLMPHMGLYELTRHVFEAVSESVHASADDREFGGDISEALSVLERETGVGINPEDIQIVRGPPVGAEGDRLLGFAEDQTGRLKILVSPEVLREFRDGEETRDIARRQNISLEEAFRVVLVRALLHEVLETGGMSHENVQRTGFRTDGLASLNEMARMFALLQRTELGPLLREGDVGVDVRLSDTEVESAVALRRALELAIFNRRLGPPADETDRRTREILATHVELAYLETFPPDLRGQAAVQNDLLEELRSLRAQGATEEEIAQRIAEALGFEDAEAVRRAARILPMALPTEVLHTRGGDGRSAIDPKTGKTAYGNAAKPTPDVKVYSSSTSSPPTREAFDRMERVRQDLLERMLSNPGGVGAYFEGRMADVRRRILQVLGLEKMAGVTAVTTPSATDVELIPLMMAANRGKPVRNLVLTETGSGTKLAAGGLYIDDQAPDGTTVKGRKGKSIPGFPAQTTQVTEMSADASDLDRQVEDYVRANIGESTVIVHLVVDSKTGLTAPQFQTIAKLSKEYGDDLMVVVDAAQGRIEPRFLQDYLDRGWIVFSSGSKFWGGVPFSGVAVIPERLRKEFMGLKDVPEGLGEFLTAADLPADVPWRDRAGGWRNASLLLRWEAALFEMEAFLYGQGEQDEITREIVLRGVIQRWMDGVRELMDRKKARTGRRDAVEYKMTGRGSTNTIVSFNVKDRHGNNLAPAQLKKLHAWLHQDVSALLPKGAADWERDVAARKYLLGQPVDLTPQEKDESMKDGVLRITLGAPLARQLADQAGPDLDQDRVEKALEQEMEDVRVLLLKIQMIVRRWDAVEKAEEARRPPQTAAVPEPVQFVNPAVPRPSRVDRAPGQPTIAWDSTEPAAKGAETKKSLALFPEDVWALAPFSQALREMGIVQEPEDLVIAVRVNQPGLIDFRFYDKRGVYIVNLQLSTEDGGQTAWLGHIEPSFVRAKLNSLPPGEREAFQQQWREMTQDWLLTRVRPWLQGRGFTEWRVRPKAGTEPGKGDGFLLGIGFQWPPNGELHFMSQRLEGPTEAGQALGMAGGLGGLANRLAARTGRPLRDFIRLFAHGEEQFMGLVFVGLITIGLGVLFHAIGLDPSLPFLALLSGFPVALRQPLFRFLHRGDLYFVKETEVGTELVRGPPTAKQRQQLWRASGRFSETFFVSTLVLSGVFLLFDLLLQSYGISIHAHVWFLAAAALAGVRAGRTHARYNLSTEGPLAVPTVGTDRDLWPPDLTPDMPASGLIHALFDGAPIRDVQDLSSFPDGSPLNGATLKRVSIEPSGRLPASGLETLYYQLGIDNRDGTSHLPEALDLLYDDTGRLVALFPVFPDGETPSIPLVDLVHYYHDARLLKGLSGLGPDEFRERVEEINRSWTEFRKSTNRAFMTIRRYVDAKRWSDLVFDTARNALTHSEHVYARIDIANADRDMDIVSDMSPLGSRLRYSENGHQVLFPVFPTVYSPEKYSNQSNDDGFYRALLGKTKARFNINPDEDSKTLVVGTGSGMDSLIAALQTKGEIWVTDINPFAVESVRHLFRLAGIEHRLRTFVMDNVADERGNPRLLDGDGRPVQFDRVVWNMPIHSARPMERKDMRRARGLWDGVGPEVLQRFAGVLPRILKTDGMALVWNHDVMDNLGNNEVEMAFRTAGSYLGLSPEARETRGPFLSDTLSFPMAVERIGQRELGSNGKFPPYVIKHATAEGREDAEPVKDEMLLNYARRAALTQDDYEKLIRTGREDVMLALAERADAPEWVLRDLAGVGGKKLMSMLCKHPSLPPDVLLDMALRGEPFVRTMSMSSPAATFASLLVVHALGGQAGFKEAKDVIPDEKRYGALGDLLLRLSGPLTQALSGLPEAQRSWGNIPPNVKAELEELLRLEPVFQAAARLPADRWKNFGSTGNLGQDLSKLTAFVEISGGGQHPLGQDDFTTQEKEELLKNAWQSGARFLADDESFRAGLASEVRDILMAEPGSPAEPVLSLPQMRESVEALMDYLRQGPGAPVTIGGRAYDVRFHYTRDAAPFRTASGREAGAFTAIDGNTIHVYARDLPGLLHESLEFLVFPQNAAVSNDRRQHHTLAFFAEALVRGAPVRGGVAMPGRAFREVDRMTDEAVLRGFVEGYEAARAQLREKFSGQPEYLRYGLTLAEAMHSRARRNAEDLAESQEIFDRFMDNLRGIQPGQPAYEEAQKLLRFREQLTTETAVLSTALSAARHFHGDIQSMGLEDVLGNTRNWLEVFDEELNRASMISARSAAGLRMRKDIREVLMTDGAAVLSMHYLRERWRSGDIDRDVMDSLFTYTWQDWFQSRTDDRDLRARFGRILREVKFSVSLRRTMARVLYPRHGRIVRVTPLDGEALRGRRRLFVSTKDLLSLQSALRMLNALVDMLDPGKIRAGDRFVVYELPGAGTDGLGIKQQNDVFGYELANNLIQMRREKLKALMQEEFGGRVTLVMPIYDNFKENTFDLRMEVTGSLSSVQMREGLDRVRQRLRAEMTEEMRRGRFREALAAKRDLLRSYGITDIDAQNLFEVRFGFADVAEATDEERLAADIQAHQAMNFEEQEYSREAYEGLIGNLTRLSGELEREAPGIFRPVQDPELGEELVLRDEVVTHLRKQHAWEDLPAADRALFRDDPRVYRLAGELFRRLKIQDYIKKWNLDFATAADEAAVVREGVQSLSLFAEAHRDREMLPDKAVKPLRGIFRKTQRYLWGDPKNRRATSVHGFHSAAPFMSRPVYINIDVRNMGGMNITQFQLEVKRIKRALDRGDWEEVSRIQRSAADEVTRNFLRMQQIVAEEYQRVREAHQAAGKPSDQLVDGSRMVLADGRMLKGRELAEYLKTHPGAGQPLVSLVGGDEYTAVVDGRLLKGRALYEFLFRVRDRIREEAHIDIRLSVSALAPFFRYKHFRRGHLADHLAHAEVILRADDQTDVLKKAEKLRQQGHNVPDMIVVDGLDESGEEPIRFGIVQGRKGQPVRYDLAPVLQQAAIRPRQAMAAFAAATLPAGLLLALSAGLQLLTGQALDVAALIPILLAPVFLMALVWLASALGWAAKALGIRAGPVDAARLVPFLQEAQDDPSVAFFEVQNGVLKVNPAVKKFLSLLPQPVQNLILYGLGIVGHEVSHLQGHGELYAYGLTQIVPAFVGAMLFGLAGVWIAGMFGLSAVFAAVFIGVFGVAGAVAAVGIVSWAMMRHRLTAGNADFWFKKSLTDKPELTVRQWTYEILFERAKEKLAEMADTFRHPKKAFRELVKRAKREGAPFVIYAVTIEVLEDVVLPFLFPSLAAFFLIFHSEPIMYPLYFVVRKLLRGRMAEDEFHRYFREAEEEMREEASLARKWRFGVELKERLTLADILKYNRAKLASDHSEDASSTLTRVGERETAAKTIGRLLRKSRVAEPTKDEEREAVDSLVDRMRSDPDPWVRKTAAGALGKILDPRTIGPLQMALIQGDPAVQGAAARSLGAFGRDAADALPQLLLLAQTHRDMWIRVYCLTAVGLIASETGDAPGDIIEIVLAQAGSRDHPVRVAAVEALGRLRTADPRVKGALAEALKSPDPTVYELALWGHVRKFMNGDGTFTDGEIIDALEEALRSSDSKARGFARRVLHHRFHYNRKQLESLEKTAALSTVTGFRFVVADDPAEAARLAQTLQEDGANTVLWAGDFRRTRSETPLDDGGRLILGANLDEEAVRFKFGRIKEGLAIRLPMLDESRGKRARERSVVPRGTVYVVGNSNEIGQLGTLLRKQGIYPTLRAARVETTSQQSRRRIFRDVLRQIVIGQDQVRPWTPYVDRGWVHRVKVEPLDQDRDGLHGAFQDFTGTRQRALEAQQPAAVSTEASYEQFLALISANQINDAELVRLATDAMLQGADIRDVIAHRLANRAFQGLEGRNLSTADLEGLAALLALLHGLGGSVMQSWETSDREQGLTPAQRAEYQRLDWEWFVQIPVLMGRDNFAEIEQAYNAARRRVLASGLDSAFHALDQALAVDGPVAVEVSERLLGEDLTPQEESTLHLLRGLFARLSEDPELLARKQVVLVADGWKRGDMLAALAERAGLGPVVAARLREAAGIRTLDARAEGAMAGDRISVQAVMRLLRMGKNQGMDIFAMDQKNWDTTGVEHLVNLLLVLSGDLVKNAASGIGEAIEKMEFIKIQA